MGIFARSRAWRAMTVALGLASLAPAADAGTLLSPGAVWADAVDDTLGFRDFFEGFHTALGARDLRDTHGLQQGLDQVQHGRVIIDDQDMQILEIAIADLMFCAGLRHRLKCSQY